MARLYSCVLDFGPKVRRFLASCRGNVFIVPNPVTEPSKKEADIRLMNVGPFLKSVGTEGFEPPTLCL